MNRTRYLWPAVFLGTFLALAAALNLKKPRILVLHSYATNFSWVRDIDAGVRRALAGKYCRVRWFCMDTKRNPGTAYGAWIGEEARDFIEQWDPDVVIAFDDNAQFYACRELVNDPATRIVYGGVNADPALYGYDQADNVCGVLERLPLAGLKEVLLEMFPHRQRILHLSDDSETSAYVHEEVSQFPWAPFHLVGSRLCHTWDAWQNAVRAAQVECDILLITHYHTIRVSATDDTRVSPEQVLRWTEQNSRVPSVGTFGFFVEDGGMMAIAVSGQEQGERAAALAVQLIESGQRRITTPGEAADRFVPYLRPAQIRSFGLAIPPLLEAFAEETGRTFGDDAPPAPTDR